MEREPERGHHLEVARVRSPSAASPTIDGTIVSTENITADVAVDRAAMQRLANINMPHAP